MNVKANLNKAIFEKVAKEQGKVGAVEIAEKIYDLSQDSCPVDTGNLKESGYVRKTEDGAEVGYSAPYAVYVNHMPQSSLHNGKAHFFTNSVTAVGGKIGE